jgi:hypothetical protein
MGEVSWEKLLGGSGIRGEKPPASSYLAGGQSASMALQWQPTLRERTPGMPDKGPGSKGGAKKPKGGGKAAVKGGKK